MGQRVAVLAKMARPLNGVHNLLRSAFCVPLILLPLGPLPIAAPPP